MSVSPLETIASKIESGRLLQATRLIARLPAGLAGQPQTRFLAALCAWRLGRIDQAVEWLEGLVHSADPVRVNAWCLLVELHHFRGAHQEHETLLGQPGPWQHDPRHRLFTARRIARTDRAAAIEHLRPLWLPQIPLPLRRIAGFEAVAWLDRLERYDEAFQLATDLHRETTPPFDLPRFLAGFRQQQHLLSRDRCWFEPKVEPVGQTALIVGLPRSGTTLLEQMLDRHPAVGGIGEYEGIDVVAEGLIRAGVWPLRIGYLPADVGHSLQREYLEGARELARPGSGWTLDKSLATWQWWPAVAAILPGAVCLHLARDPRDLAISQFLSDLDPIDKGWTASFDGLRAVLGAEQQLSDLACRRLGLPVIRLTYETLVQSPEETVRSVLSGLELPFDPVVLHPEQNVRSAVTLSHAQVRQPVHARSVGRWKKYSFAWDARWDRLVEQHQDLPVARVAGGDPPG
jgi:hypothetical protein